MTPVQIEFMRKVFDLNDAEIKILSSMNFVMSDNEVVAFGKELKEHMESCAGSPSAGLTSVDELGPRIAAIGDLTGLVTYSMLMSLLRYEISVLSGSQLCVFEGMASEVGERTKKEIVAEANDRLRDFSEAVEKATEKTKEEKTETAVSEEDEKWGKA
jgi:hypothetical protein